MRNNSKIREININNIQCMWVLFCSLSSTDRDTNNISLFNVIEQFNITKDFFLKQKEPNKPLLFMHPCEIVSCWRRTLDVVLSDEEIFTDLKIKTVDPTGVVLQEILTQLKFPRGMKRLRSRVVMQGLLVSKAGDYVHQIEIKLLNQKEFKKVFEIPFEIRQVDSIKK